MGADIMVRPPNSSVMSTLSSAPISDKYVAWLMQQPHVVLATGTVIQGLTLPDSITGLDFAGVQQDEWRLHLPFRRRSRQRQRHHRGPVLRAAEASACGRHGAPDQPRLEGLRASSRAASWRTICVKLTALQEITGTPGHLTRIYVKLDDPKLADQMVDDLKAKLPSYPIYSMEELTSMFSINNVGMLKDFIWVVITVAVIVGFIVVFHGDVYGGAGADARDRDLKAVGGVSGLVLDLLLPRDAAAGGDGDCGGHCADLWDAVADEALGAAPAWCRRRCISGGRIAGGIAIVGAMLGVVVPGMKAVRQDVTEALSYE